MWWLLVGFFTGRGLRQAGLPDSIKQQHYDEAMARRARRAQMGRPTLGQWMIVIFAVMIVLGLLINLVGAVFG